MESNPPKQNHGGARPGSGPKPKEPSTKAVTGSLSMLREEWAKLDAMRGKTPRGRFVAGRLKL